MFFFSGLFFLGKFVLIFELFLYNRGEFINCYYVYMVGFA